MDGPRRDARREALACTANLIIRLSKAGVHHRDLNAENVLIARDAQHVHAILLDLDGCRVAGPGRPVRCRRAAAAACPLHPKARTHTPAVPK